MSRPVRISASRGTTRSSTVRWRCSCRAVYDIPMTTAPVTHGADFALTLSCEDTIGIVHAVSGFLVEHGCNIIDSAQFGDPDTHRFFMRVAFASGSGRAQSAA